MIMILKREKKKTLIACLSHGGQIDCWSFSAGSQENSTLIGFQGDLRFKLKFWLSALADRYVFIGLVRFISMGAGMLLRLITFGLPLLSLETVFPTCTAAC